MVDAVGTIAKVIEAALKMKKAADTVKQNEGLCKQIISRVDILSNSLSQHQNNAELMDNSAVRVALEALDGTLGEALKLVMDCQEETNLVCLSYNSGNLSQRLKEVEQRISSKNMDAMFAIMGFLLPKQFNQHGAHPQPQQVNPASTKAPLQSQTMLPPYLPKQMSRQHNQDGGDVNVQTDDEPYAEIFRRARTERSDYGEHNIPVFGDWDDSMTNKKPAVSEDDDFVSEWDHSMVALCSCCAMAKKSKPARQPPGDGLPRRSLLQQIAAVALKVNEAAETVLQNKEDCIEIGKRMRSVSAILSQLEGTEMVQKQAMKMALKKLLMNFRYDLSLVQDCQSSGIAAMFFCSPPSKLCKQIRAELDAMVSDVNAIIAVNGCV